MVIYFEFRLKKYEITIDPQYVQWRPQNKSLTLPSSETGLSD